MRTIHEKAASVWENGIIHITTVYVCCPYGTMQYYAYSNYGGAHRFYVTKREDGVWKPSHII